MHYCTFKGDKGKRLDVQSKSISFFPGKLLFVNSFQKLVNSFQKFLHIVIYCKKSDLLILTGDLDHKL